MNFKRSRSYIQDKNASDLDDNKDYLTNADLMIEQKNSKDEPKTIHYRRDLDSLG